MYERHLETVNGPGMMRTEQLLALGPLDFRIHSAQKDFPFLAVSLSRSP